MFLNLLSDRQKQSFLALATKVVMADGGVAVKEHVTLNVRVAEMGGDIKAPPDEIYGAPNFDVFDTPQAQTIVLLELMVIAYSDGEYHEDERPIIKQLAEHFGLSSADMKRFEDWAIRQSPLSVEGWKFIVASGPVDI
ncbi:MAG: TerB family tellurite resistance protein [Rhodospirillales bacterium]